MIRTLLRLLVLVMFSLGYVSTAHAESSGFLDALRKVVRVGSELNSDVPTSSIARGLRRVSPPDALAKAPDGRALTTALKLSDPALLLQIERLTPEESDIALRLFAGSEALLKASRDPLARARAIESGGGDLLFAAERYGNDMTTPAFRLLAAEDAGQLPKGTLQRFSETVALRGDPVLRLWNKKILPNWKQLAAAGVLVDIVFNDGGWISEAGEFTAESLKKLVQIGIDVAVDTTVEIPKQIVQSLWSKLWSANGPWILIILLIVALPVAIWLSRIYKGWLNTLRKIWLPVRKRSAPSAPAVKVPKRNPFGGGTKGIEK